MTHQAHRLLAVFTLVAFIVSMLVFCGMCIRMQDERAGRITDREERAKARADDGSAELLIYQQSIVVQQTLFQ